MKTTSQLVRIASMQRTIPPRNIDYKSVSRMIDKAAHKFSSSFGVPFEDMQAQGNLLFSHAVYKFNFSQKRTKFSTFLHTVLHNGLISYGERQLRRHETILNPIENEDDIYDPLDYISDAKVEREFMLKEMYLFLTNDERELVDLVLMGFASTLTSLKKLAMKRLNFEKAQFEEAVYGIKKMLKDIEE